MQNLHIFEHINFIVCFPFNNLLIENCLHFLLVVFIILEYLLKLFSTVPTMRLLIIFSILVALKEFFSNMYLMYKDNI